MHMSPDQPGSDVSGLRLKEFCPGQDKITLNI